MPFICTLMIYDTPYSRIASFILTIFVSITDFLDGYIARKYNFISRFGVCFDPIADKVLITSVMIILIYLEKANVIPCIIILVREILVSGIREFIAKDGAVIPVSFLAKWKTASQMIAVALLMIAGVNYFIFFFGNFVLWLAALLSVITCYEYIRDNKKYLS